MIQAGKRQSLSVDREDNSGYYLHQGEDEVFLPKTLAPAGICVGENVDVFVFIDGKGDVVATGKMPLAEVGEFAFLQVKNMTNFGAYLDIGLPKDLLLPKSLQRYESNVGEMQLVLVCKDEDTGQLYGTQKFNSYIEPEDIILSPSQGVTLVPFHRTPMGYKVLIDKKYLGLVYHSEIFFDVELGREYEGTIKAVRDDGQVDALLRKTGLGGLQVSSEIILSALNRAGGKLPLCDKSSPAKIEAALGMSKKSFKSAIGMLYQKRLIRICEGFIELV